MLIKPCDNFKNMDFCSVRGDFFFFFSEYTTYFKWHMHTLTFENYEVTINKQPIQYQLLCSFDVPLKYY